MFMPLINDVLHEHLYKGVLVYLKQGDTSDMAVGAVLLQKKAKGEL